MAADQLVINYGETANDGTGDPLRDAFIKVDDNFNNIWSAGPVGSNVTIINNTIGTTNTNGNLILSPNGIGIIQTNNHVLPRAGNLYNFGSPTQAFRTAYIGVGGLYVSGNIELTGNIFGNLTFGNVITANVKGSIISSDGVDVLVNAVSKSLYAESGNVTGNLSAGYFIGDGSQLSNLTISAGTEIVNGNSNVVVAANSSVSVSVAGVPDVAVFNPSNVTVSGAVVASEFQGNGAPLSNTLTDRGNDTNNWDTLIQMGAYKVNRTDWSGTIGTPLDSSVYVGLLQVSTAIDTTTQTFFPGTVQVGDAKYQWSRTLWGGTWTAWTKMINNGQIIDAGSF